MPKPPQHDLAGRRFGRFVVESLAPPEADRTRRRSWVCRCDCGVTETCTAVALLHSRASACRVCSNRPKIEADRTCVVCGRPYRGHPRSRFCSAECVYRRRKHGLPEEVFLCEACGGPCPPSSGLVAKSCSPDCAKMLSRRRYAAKAKKIQAGRKAKVDAMPLPELAVWLAKRAEYHARWYRKLRERFAGDPLLHAAFMARRREYMRGLRRLSVERDFLSVAATLRERLLPT